MAMKICNITFIVYYRNNSVVVDLLWGRYHIPENIFLVYSARSNASPSTWIHSNTTLWCSLNGLHAAGYKSAESEPIWMKFGKLSAKCWGLAMADFGRDPRSSHSLRGSRKNVCFLVR